jgi:hypothetical protein
MIIIIVGGKGAPHDGFEDPAPVVEPTSSGIMRNAASRRSGSGWTSPTTKRSASSSRTSIVGWGWSRRSVDG